MPAIPFVVGAAGSYIGGKFAEHSANSAQKKASQMSPEEQQLFQQQQGIGQQFTNQGRQLFGAAMPGIQSTLNYYQTLLSGDRAARTAAVAPEAEQTSEAYAGAEGAINRNLQGGERAQAQAENSRQRAGSIARLTSGVRPGAAAALGDMGSRLVGQSAQFEGAGADVGSNLLSGATQNRQFGYKAGQQAGQNTAGQIGKLVSQLLPMLGKGGNAGSLLPSRETTMNSGFLPAGGSGSPGLSSGISY